jgi:hypothetical protein
VVLGREAGRPTTGRAGDACRAAAMRHPQSRPHAPALPLRIASLCRVTDHVCDTFHRRCAQHSCSEIAMACSARARSARARCFTTDAATRSRRSVIGAAVRWREQVAPPEPSVAWRASCACGLSALALLAPAGSALAGGREKVHGCQPGLATLDSRTPPPPPPPQGQHCNPTAGGRVYGQWLGVQRQRGGDCTGRPGCGWRGKVAPGCDRTASPSHLPSARDGGGSQHDPTSVIPTSQACQA